MAKRLSTPEMHALRVARSTMSMHCTGARIVGGPDHREAAETIYRLTDKRATIHPDCTCVARQGKGDRR